VISGPDRASLEVSRFIGPPAPVLRAVAVEDVLGHLRDILGSGSARADGRRPQEGRRRTGYVRL